MPLFHIGGLSVLIRSALVGTSAVIHENFDPRRVADCLEADRITRVSFVATMLEQVIVARGEKRCPATLRLVLLGGGPASTSLLQRAEALGYPIAPTYGLTEAASQVATRPPLDPFDPLVPDGRDRNGGLVPLPGVGLRILDENGNLASVGEEGEILVRGPIVMQGYFDEPTATAAAIVDGWLRTGDIGRIDASGHLRVLDRRADLILAGGENVYPAEIESVIAGHPDVEGVGVVGRPDERFGARPVAYVIWRGAEPFDDKRLESFCRERLAGYKIPIEFHETPRLPRTTSGKLIRRLLE
jgi:O-succinylbenzoic acid--CoA ligase